MDSLESVEPISLAYCGGTISYGALKRILYHRQDPKKGCPLPLVKTDITVEHNVVTPMRDGTLLRADLYLPEKVIPIGAMGASNGGGGLPTLVCRTPYDKSRERDAERYRGLASNGYAVVVQDKRGRWESDGLYRPMYGAQFDDAEDGYDTIEWAAAQSWSNGKVGTFGYSYPSWTQWMLAPLMPPHLVTMFTGGMGPKTTDWEMGGVFRPGRALQWLLGLIAPDTQKWLDEAQGPTTIADYDAITRIANREKWLWFLPWSELPLEAVGGLREGFHDWLRNHHKDRFGFVGNFSKIDLPVHHRTGWYDRLIATTDMYDHMINEAPSGHARSNQRLFVGPYTHANEMTRMTGDMDFGPDAEIDWVELATSWFDYWLKGQQNGVMDGAPVNIFVMGANMWRREETWPPARAVHTDLFLHSRGGANTPSGDGELSLEGPGSENPDSYVYDPRDPVMSLYLANGQDGPFDQRMNAHRRDILVYQTEPLKQAIEVTGDPVLRLHVASDAVDTDFTVKLIDVHPDGTGINLCYGFQRARFRNGLDEPTVMMTPGDVYEFEIKLLPTSNLFKIGHRIRIDISSSDYPNHDRNHNSGADDWQDAELRVARQTVFHDATRPSRITLPVIEE